MGISQRAHRSPIGVSHRWLLLLTGAPHDSPNHSISMPYKSAKQERWAHTDSAKDAGFPTEEFDEASEGMKFPDKPKRPLPEHLKKRIGVRRALKAKT